MSYSNFIFFLDFSELEEVRASQDFTTEKVGDRPQQTKANQYIVKEEMVSFYTTIFIATNILLFIASLSICVLAYIF